MKLRVILPGIVIVAALAAVVFFLKKNPAPQAGEQSSGEKTRGPENAQVSIVEYSDFQCPACQKAQETLTKLLTDYPTQIKLIFKHFPLSMHVWAPLAHQAAECARTQGKFWEMHDQLYAKQQEWSGPAHPSENFIQMAKEAGLNIDQFAACLSNPAINENIMKDRKRGEELQVNSTPTFFIDGERLVGPVELQVKGENLIRKTLGLDPKPRVTPAPVVPNAPAIPMTPSQMNLNPPPTQPGAVEQNPPAPQSPETQMMTPVSGNPSTAASSSQ